MHGRVVSVLVMAASAIFPIHGLSVDLCFVHAATGLPCPGCGLSRGLSAITQGHFAHALTMNPFALLIWPMLAFIAVMAFVPARVRDRVRGAASGPLFGKIYRLFVLAFVVFGCARLIVFMSMGWRFP